MPNRNQIQSNHTGVTTTTMTRPSRRVASGAQSAFHSAAQTSGHTSDGLFLPLLLAFLCLPLAVPLLWSSGLYDWYRDLDIERQFRVTALFCFGTLLYAAAARELCIEPLAQWSGRIAGLAGFILLLMFSWKASMLCGAVIANDRVEQHFNGQQIVTREDQ